MKKILAIGISFLVPLVSFSQEKMETKVLRGVEANMKYSGTTVIRENQYSTIPSFIQFRSGSEIPEEKLSTWLTSTFQLDTRFGILLTGTEKDHLGYIHNRFQQTFKSIPIEFTMYITHNKSGMINAMNGMLINSLPKSTIPGITENNALQIALSHVNASRYRWEVEVGLPPKGEIVFVPPYGDFSNPVRLAWKFDIYAYEPLYKADVFVDALTGEIIFEHNMIHTVDDSGTAVTGYSGTVTIVVDSTAPGSYRLRETGRGNGIETYDMNKGTNYGSAVDFTDADNYWNNVNAQLDQYATDAQWGSEMTYDYFKNVHGRNSIDDAGFKLKSYVHYGNNYKNAFWNGSQMTYGDGNSGKPYQCLDVCGHEISHGLTSFTSSLIYSKESGALNESFSDIFGTLIEFYGKPDSANWLMGEDLGNAFRSMSNPKAKGDPDCYEGVNWHTTSNDNFGVHTNSGVQNHWFYILSEGKTGVNDNNDSFSVAGLGMSVAANIAFRTNTFYLYPSADYEDARFFSTQSAIDLFGGCSQEVLETATAWYAVGVGGPFDSTVTADFTSEWQESCSVPFLAEFINQSANGESFIWNFGDTSSTSTIVNPDHTYNQYGSFDVTLYVDGGVCGADTITKTAYISVDSANHCYVILPQSGPTQVQTSCTGTVYDDGGPNGDYSGNTDIFVTISPPGASQIMLLFPHFDMEFGNTGSCNFDFLEIFDGPDTSSASLGQWCNTTGPPDTILSSGAHITIRQYTDPGLSLSGFEIPWQCIMPDAPPIAGFHANLTHTCNGVIQFYDNSVPTPASWHWDFGDGDTSNLQNPVHTYSSNDTFTVSLTATDSGGSSMATRIDYIVVDRPPMLTTTSDSGCALSVLTLTSSGGTGTTFWYDTIIGGSAIGSGNTFIAPVLNYTKSYYAQDHIPVSSQYVGPADTTIGGGGFNNSKQYLLFDVSRTCTLVSVKVYADTTKDRTIELRDEYGIVINSVTANIPIGESRVTLNFVLTPGYGYALGISTTGSGLYRNNTGVNFPYVISDWISITHCSVENDPDKYYYFFYDWEIRGHDCSSARQEAVAFIKPDDFTISISGDSIVCEKDSVTLTASGGMNYVWSTGDSNTASITHLPAKSPQDYSVISYADCSTDTGYHSIVIDSLPAASFTYVQDSSRFSFTNKSKYATSVSWDFGDGNTSTDQHPNHEYSAPGSYEVVLTVTNDCGTADTTVTVIVEEYTSGILNINEFKFTIHPNPANSTISIFNNLQGNSIRIIVINILGQEVYKQDHQFLDRKLLLDISAIPEGIYIIKLIAEKGQYLQKLVVQK